MREKPKRLPRKKIRELDHEENQSSPDGQWGQQMRSNCKPKELCMKNQAETNKATYAWKQAAVYRVCQSIRMGNTCPTAVFPLHIQLYQYTLYSITISLIPLKITVGAVVFLKYAQKLLETPFKRWNLIPFPLNMKQFLNCLIFNKQKVAKVTVYYV